MTEPAKRDSSGDIEPARKAVVNLYEKHPEVHSVCPPERLQVEVRVRIPDNATPEAAWKGASEMMQEILDLVAQEELKKQKPMPINPPTGNVT